MDSSPNSDLHRMTNMLLLTNEAYARAKAAFLGPTSTRLRLYYDVHCFSSIVLSILIYIRLMQAIVRYFAPPPGTGASEEVMANGFIMSKAFAYDEAGQLMASATIDGVGDGGYLITSKMLSEVALCLAHDKHDGAVGSGGFLLRVFAAAHWSNG